MDIRAKFFPYIADARLVSMQFTNLDGPLIVIIIITEFERNPCVEWKAEDALLHTSTLGQGASYWDEWR